MTTPTGWVSYYQAEEHTQVNNQLRSLCNALRPEKELQSLYISFADLNLITEYRYQSKCDYISVVEGNE